MALTKRKQPVGYANRVLLDTEKRYSISELDLLAVIKNSSNGAKLTRWTDRLAYFDIHKIKHIMR